jgi:ribosomal-protein-alanine N-acetyltransferase
VALGWSITRKADGQFIGLGGVEGVENTNDGELDYCFGRPYWGRGYATEAARAMTCYGFEHSAWDRIVAAVVPANIPSSRVLDHLGFVYEKEVNYNEMVGNYMIVLEPSPIVAYYALGRGHFQPGDALYRVSMTATTSMNDEPS